MHGVPFTADRPGCSGTDEALCRLPGDGSLLPQARLAHRLSLPESRVVLPSSPPGAQSERNVSHQCTPPKQDPIGGLAAHFPGRPRWTIGSARQAGAE